MSESKNYMDLLRDRGLKNTRHRVRILEILETGSQPLVVDDIYSELKDQDVSMSLSTVYRTLEALTEKQIVNKVALENDPRVFYEFNRMTHHHFLICIGCNKIITVNECPIHEYEAAVAKQKHFLVIGHKLELYGYCPECQKQKQHAPYHHDDHHD